MTTKLAGPGAKLSVALAVGAVVVSSMVALGVSPVSAATTVYTVTQPVDDAVPTPANCPANGVLNNCTLRDAVQAAVLLPRPSDSRVNFSQGGQYTLTNGAIDIVSPGAGAAAITIQGFTASAGGTVIDGNLADRLFNVHLNQIVTLSLNDLTLQRGSTSGSGGAIFNGATVNLRNVVLTQNAAGANGGAIENPGSGLTVDQSTFQSNTAALNGGAIDDPPAEVGSLMLTRSTLSGNTTTNGSGGAIANYGGLTQLFNDTLYGNTASGTVFPAGAGGAIFAAGSVLGGGSQGNTELTYVTLAGNSARTGGAVFNDNVLGMSLRADILSNNPPNNCAGTQQVSSLGYNLQFGGATADSCQFAAQGKPGEVVGNDPLLNAAANNGGVTLTMLPQPGSPAIDQIPQLPLTQCPLGPPYPFSSEDQRLLARPQAANCDIGAVETPAAASPPPPSTAPLPLAPNTGTGGSLRP